MKMMCGFETELVRITMLSENDIQAYYVREVGLGYDNDHDVMKKFDSFSDASDFYDYIRNLLISNNVKIIKEF